MKTLVRNGTIATGQNVSRGDILIRDGHIHEISERITAPDAETTDAAGKYVLPGAAGSICAGERAAWCKAMNGKIRDIGCVVMASGLSARYGKNKLLEDLGGRPVILRTVEGLISAGLAPLVVTRGTDIAARMDREGIACVRHDGPLKSDTMHAGLEALPRDAAGFLFMPADQPLVSPDSLKRLATRFLENPTRAARLGFGDTPGSPVIFPAACREALLAYRGDRGGAEVQKKRRIPCDTVQAAHPWELWDVDTPEAMARVREIYRAGLL